MFVKKISYLFNCYVLIMLYLFFISDFFFVYSLPKKNLNSTKITIYHTNDINGEVFSEITENNETLKIGLDTVKSAKDQTPNSILIDTGNFIHGSLLAKHEKGKYIINLMNASSYDVVALGNNEFDIGYAELKNRINEANFPILASNVKFNNDNFSSNSKSNGENCIIEKNGKRIGFFAIINKENFKKNKFNNKNLEILDEIECSINQVNKLKLQKVDKIVAILNFGSNSYFYEKIKNIGIDFIINSNINEESVKNTNSTLVSQTSSRLNYLGRIDLMFNGSELKVNSSLINSIDSSKLFGSDENVKKMLSDYNNEIYELSEKVVGKVDNSIFGGTYLSQNISRVSEVPIGNLICDSMIWYAKKLIKSKFNSNEALLKKINDLPIVSFEKGGSIKKTIPKGYITFSDIISVLPLDNSITFQIITPYDLYETIERGLGKIQLPSEKNQCFNGSFFGFPQVSGIKIEFDISNKEYDYITNSGGNRVTSITLCDENDKEIKKILRNDNETKILFLCNDYTLYDFPLIENKEIIYKGELLSNILSDYILKLTLDSGGIFSYPFLKNRIVMKKNIKFSEFDSEITISNSFGPLSFTNFKILIDKENEKNFKTDEKGKIYLKKLKTGLHKILIKLENKSKEIVISNILDLKNINVSMDEKINEDYNKVSNIIGQIPYNINLKDFNFINFARLSYNSLDDVQKSRVFNYSKLENAEKEISKLKGNIVGEFFSKNDNKKILIFTILLIFSIFFLYFTNKYKKRKYI